MAIRRILLASAALLIVCVSPPTARAQTADAPPAAAKPSPEALAAATELLAVLGSTPADPAKNWQIIAASMSKAKFDAATMAALETEYLRIRKEQDAALQSSAAAIYASNLSVAEMRNLTAFYKTPLGQKAAAALPKVAAEYSLAAQQHNQEIQAATFIAFRKVLRDHGYMK